MKGATFPLPVEWRHVMTDSHSRAVARLHSHSSLKNNIRTGRHARHHYSFEAKFLGYIYIVYIQLVLSQTCIPYGGLRNLPCAGPIASLIPWSVSEFTAYQNNKDDEAAPYKRTSAEHNVSTFVWTLKLKVGGNHRKGEAKRPNQLCC